MGLLLAAPQAQGQPHMTIHEFGPQKTGADAWFGARLSRLLAHKLRLLGYRIRIEQGPGSKSKTTRGGSIVRGQIHPDRVTQRDQRVQAEVSLFHQGAHQRVRAQDRAHHIERLATSLALTLAKKAGRQVDVREQILLSRDSTSFSVQKLVGRAWLREKRGDFRQALVMYDRAYAKEKVGTAFEALAGRHRVMGELAARGKAKLGARDELAQAAWQRAEVAVRQKRDKEAKSALRSFLRYTEARAQRWRLAQDLAKKHVRVVQGDAYWVLQTGWGPQDRMRIDARTGSVLARGRGIQGLVAIVDTDLLSIHQNQFIRYNEKLKRQWSAILPFSLDMARPSAVELTSGLVGIKTTHQVQWVETSFGAKGQEARGVVPLASSAGGIAVLSRAQKGTSPGRSPPGSQLGLLRPGKKTPAWRISAEPSSVAMTTDRVLLLSASGLTLLRAHNGKPLGPPLPLPKATRVLGAHGRYAALESPGHTIHLVDVLGGEITARFLAPEQGVDAYAFSSGVAVLYASGDLVFYDRDGLMTERVHVPGRPIKLLRANPLAPGPVAWTSRGLFAFAKLSEPTEARDLRALLILAKVLDRLGESTAALDIATHVALGARGHVAEAERMRNHLYARQNDPASRAAAAAAQARAKSAQDPARPLPPFALIPAPPKTAKAPRK